MTDLFLCAKVYVMCFLRKPFDGLKKILGMVVQEYLLDIRAKLGLFL